MLFKSYVNQVLSYFINLLGTDSIQKQTEAGAQPTTRGNYFKVLQWHNAFIYLFQMLSLE